MTSDEYKHLEEQWRNLHKGIVQTILHVETMFLLGCLPEKQNLFVEIHKKLLKDKKELMEIRPNFKHPINFCILNLNTLGPEIDKLIKLCKKEFNIKLKNYRPYQLSSYIAETL